MNCPWCGKEMLPGKMMTYGNTALMWESTDREYSKTERFFGDHRKMIRCTEKLFTRNKSDALYCRDCKKFIFDGWLE